MVAASAVEMVIMATLGCSPAQAHAEYASIEAILINLEQPGPLGQGTVTAQVLNVREEHRATATIVGTLKTGDAVRIWGRTPAGDWLAIDEPMGWVARQWVREGGKGNVECEMGNVECEM